MTGRETSVSTHVLDTGEGRPAAGVAVRLAVAVGDGGEWAGHAESRTDQDGRCRDLPVLPPGARAARLAFGTGDYLDRRGRSAFFPEVTVVFAVRPGEHHHVPLLLSPFGYSVYRGS